jgi:pyridoxine/pyridoxamine 5'-phosphate oxidase
MEPLDMERILFPSPPSDDDFGTFKSGQFLTPGTLSAILKAGIRIRFLAATATDQEQTGQIQHPKNAEGFPIRAKPCRVCFWARGRSRLYECVSSGKSGK